MEVSALRHAIAALPEGLLRHRELEKQLAAGYPPRKTWYRSQKEHWLGWLEEYQGPGAYGRKGGADRDAAFAFNRIQCAPMLFWLAEAARIDVRKLNRAKAEILAAGGNGARQCAAFRRIISWEMIEQRLG